MIEIGKERQVLHRCTSAFRSASSSGWTRYHRLSGAVRGDIAFCGDLIAHIAIRLRIRQSIDIKAVVVPAPLAAMQHSLRNLLECQVCKGIGFGPKRRAADQQGAFVADLITDELQLLLAEILSRDVDQIRLSRLAVNPEGIGIW